MQASRFDDRLHPTLQSFSTISPLKMSARVSDHDEAMATADKQMEERANRARQLLSERYRGLRNDQVSITLLVADLSVLMIAYESSFLTDLGS